MNEFKIGTNFDFDLLSKIIEINEKSENKVTEIYGSDRLHADLAARPDFRLPDVDNEIFYNYVNKAKENGINFNYTMNSIMPYGSKNELAKNINFLIHFISVLKLYGVYRITVANPAMLEIIRNYAKSDIEVEVSTIMHIDTITQIKYLHENYGVKKICANLNKNRDFEWLENAANYCNKNDIILELMVNEFCGVGGNNYATHCVYRDSCYICHATNQTYEDTLSLDNYPMNLCTNSRNKDISNWLRLKWIRPEDLKYYNDIGINHFKITGRTGSSEYLQKVLNAYMAEDFDGNLIELWKPLESINPDVKEAEVKNFYIGNKKLNGFIDIWAKRKHNCDYQICGETCNYCNWFYNRYIK